MPAHALRRTAWIFDRADRLAYLAERARELSEALRRERCDQFHGRPAAARLAERMAVNEYRFRCLSHDARHERRGARAIMG